MDNRLAILFLGFIFIISSISAASGFPLTTGESVANVNFTNVTAQLLPSPAYTDTDLLGYCQAATSDGSDVSFSYNFLRNGISALAGTYPNPVISATGGTVSSIIDNGIPYTIHSFTSNGTFNVTGLLNVTVLIVGGGGGGGSRFGGGGGAGGLIYTQYMASGIIPVIIGSGGPGGVDTGGLCQFGNGPGGQGVYSVFGSLTANGGGGGGCGDNGPGSFGGSGGGGAGRFATSGGSGVTGQGNAGGYSSGLSPYRGAGGGGAGEIGHPGGTNPPDGYGGSGVPLQISGITQFYAAGGGGGGSSDGYTSGGIGGSGIGGNGGSYNDIPIATNGVANTGSGGGGGAIGLTTNRPGAAGGSGIVIVRYPTQFETVAQGVNVKVATITKDLLHAGDRWKLQCYAFNQNGISNMAESPTVTIMDRTPTPTPSPTISPEELLSRIQALETRVGQLEATDTSQNNRLGLLEQAVSALQVGLQQLQYSFNNFMVSQQEFNRHLNFLPLATRTDMVCAYMNANKLTTDSAFGLICSIDPKKVCSCGNPPVKAVASEV